MRVVLTYLDHVSNWGPRNASGVAEIVRQEGEVRVSAVDVAPSPAPGATRAPEVHYVAWLGKEGTSESFRLGELTVAKDGSARLDRLLPDAIPDQKWNLVLITAEDSASATRPGPRRFLAGRYPRPTLDGTLPYGLPNTGRAAE